MASNKNQHFVPRCYLKPFTLNGEGAAMNLFNIDRQRFVYKAPVKNQCSRDYFYGKDLVLEKELQKYEAEYADLLSKIRAPGYLLQECHKIKLLRFWLLQYMRTEAASRRSVEISIELEEGAGAENGSFRQDIKSAVQTYMDFFFTSYSYVADLKVCLVRNRTGMSFLTSDDPAVLTNRWHFQSDRAKGISPGLSSSGALLILPLSPEILCVAYDGDVYSFLHKNGWINLGSESDVFSFNQHQYLNCRANIYFSLQEDEARVKNEFNAVFSCRSDVRHRINYAVLDKDLGYEKTFRAVDRIEARKHQHALMHVETIFPRPTSWPSLISWRASGAVYSNGTAAGFVRRGTIGVLGGDGFKKIKLR